MAGIEQPQYTVNVSQENLINKFAVQGEENSRVLTLHLVENVSTENALQQTEIRQKPLDLTGCTARLYTKKPDGNATFINGEIIATGADGNPNTVTFVLSQQTTAATGNAHCTVAVFGSNGTELKATGITLDIAADDMEQTIVSTSEFVSLAEALGSVQESEQKADKAVLDAQTAVTNATTAITDITQKQAAMDTAESNRVTAESGRVTAESGRVTAEQSRIAAEQTRQTAETKRETDSQAAITAANAATEKANHVPQRDASGVWKDWDTESQTYKNSADQWKGEKGDTGAAFAYGESYTTVDALKAAYPTGDAKGHLVNGTAYVWDGTAWVATSVDLTEYYKKTESDAKYAGINHTHTAAQVGARPDTWMPTAADVGARPSTWTPTASDIGLGRVANAANIVSTSAPSGGSDGDTWDVVGS
ncbi:BppU family phage baseplate upper protein [Caproicibacterium amylolyticum]|uniref:BppU family phage baseplate upper protein n=1 Tax=Caproicibacterium amylolyticum TaxID=2766537 RepID=A0A7G9WJZ9_9FIRM|nr:BppU family phage baseplate upper protein [Caproicibacterium amylolyticum]QNO19011.1 BppU family phage baseplate upper protein [Caproicibacterium amylolyticum]